ncbi:MAG: class I SAM-dependent methyltransferase [Candidatus Omnitrophota bacterium]
MRQTAEELYKDYWVGAAEERGKRRYYQRLYQRVLPKIQWNETDRILDVAGGNGQLLRFLGIKKADILDISRSGLDVAKKEGFRGIWGDIEKRFPIAEETYDVVFLFEVLEHLCQPNKTLSEINNVLKPSGVIYVGQPNMRADGVHHVRRYYLSPLLDDLEKSGFSIDWVDYVPAYSMRDSILSDIKRNSSWIRKSVQSINLLLSFLPWTIRYIMAKIIPDRFALMFIVKARKMESASVH